MKKICLVVLSALLVLGLAGCGQPKFDETQYSEITVKCSETVTEYRVTDPEEIAWVVDLLNGCAVTGTKKRPDTSGWSYCLFFWDTDGEHLYSAEIGPDFLEFHDRIYCTNAGYFQPILDLVDRKGGPMT